MYICPLQVGNLTFALGCLTVSSPTMSCNGAASEGGFLSPAFACQDFLVHFFTLTLEPNLLFNIIQ